MVPNSWSPWGAQQWAGRHWSSTWTITSRSTTTSQGWGGRVTETHREIQRVSETEKQTDKETEMTWVFETAKPTSGDTPPPKARPHNPSQMVLPTGNQAFKRMRSLCEPFSLKQGVPKNPSTSRSSGNNWKNLVKTMLKCPTATTQASPHEVSFGQFQKVYNYSNPLAWQEYEDVRLKRIPKSSLPCVGAQAHSSKVYRKTRSWEQVLRTHSVAHLLWPHGKSPYSASRNNPAPMKYPRNPHLSTVAVNLLWL